MILYDGRFVFNEAFYALLRIFFYYLSRLVYISPIYLSHSFFFVNFIEYFFFNKLSDTWHGRTSTDLSEQICTYIYRLIVLDLLVDQLTSLETSKISKYSNYFPHYRMDKQQIEREVESTVTILSKHRNLSLRAILNSTIVFLKVNLLLFHFLQDLCRLPISFPSCHFYDEMKERYRIICNFFNYIWSWRRSLLIYPFHLQTKRL